VWLGWRVAVRGGAEAFGDGQQAVDGRDFHGVVWAMSIRLAALMARSYQLVPSGSGST
jgi:hypothetical protein